MKEDIFWSLKKTKFINVATVGINKIPCAAPKFVLKVEDDFIYLVDYTLGTTYQNLSAYPRISLSLMMDKNLKGYQINGTVKVIEKGTEYDKLLNEFREKEIKLTVERLIEGVHRGKAHTDYEIEISKRIVIFKVRIKEIIELCPEGRLVVESFPENLLTKSASLRGTQQKK
jgi:hypothetical protein